MTNTFHRTEAGIQSMFGGTVTNENAGITLSAKDANVIREVWEKADNAAANAYRAGVQAQANGVKYEVRTDANGNKYVKVDNHVLCGFHC